MSFEDSHRLPIARPVVALVACGKDRASSSRRWRDISYAKQHRFRTNSFATYSAVTHASSKSGFSSLGTYPKGFANTVVWPIWCLTEECVCP